MSLKKYLSDLVINTIKSGNPDITDSRVAELEYGFLTFYLTITKFIVIFPIAWWLQVVPEVVTVITLFAVVRSYAGGVHAESSLMCLITTSATFFGVTYAAKGFVLSQSALIVMSCIAMVLFYLYAPADHYNKPIRSEKHRLRQKRRTIILSVCCLTLAIFTPLVFKKIIVLSIFVESLLITPLAYQITNTRGGEFYEKTI